MKLHVYILCMMTYFKYILYLINEYEYMVTIN